MYSFYKKKKTYLQHHDQEEFNNFKKQIVVSRYSEDISWINDKEYERYNILCYNKGKSLPECINCSIKLLPNVGRCDHTYIYHIVNNYDNLADVTIFLPGSCMDSHKKDFTQTLLRYVNTTNDTVLLGKVYDTNIKDYLYNFVMEKYQMRNIDNNKMNNLNDTMLSSIRPFGLWYHLFFDEIDTRIVCYYGILAVSRDDILSRPKSFYEEILNHLSVGDNLEAGHYVERSWGAIFRPKKSCIYSYEYPHPVQSFTNRSWLKKVNN